VAGSGGEPRAHARAVLDAVALPILAPSLLGSFLPALCERLWCLRTAWTLTGPDVNLVTVQIAALVRGEVQLDPALADAPGARLASE